MSDSISQWLTSPQNSNLFDHGTRSSQTDRWTDGQTDRRIASTWAPKDTGVGKYAIFSQ